MFGFRRKLAKIEKQNARRLCLFNYLYPNPSLYSVRLDLRRFERVWDSLTYYQRMRYVHGRPIFELHETNRCWEIITGVTVYGRLIREIERKTDRK